MKKKPAFGLLLAVLLLIPLLTAGCSSAFVSATITNHSGSSLALIEVNYPSASFGVDSLAAGAAYSYRFKIQGAGQVKIQFTDASGKAHSASGPTLVEGEQGALGITIGPVNDVSWVPNLSKIR